MKCKCGDVMEGVTGYDDPPRGYAYNLYQCNSCGMLCKQDVWNNKGLTWISLCGKVIGKLSLK